MHQFIPVVRPSNDDWDVVAELSDRGGIAEYVGSPSELEQPTADEPPGSELAIPLIEVTSSSGLDTPVDYDERFDQVLVDSPVYLPDNELVGEDATNSSEAFEDTGNPIPIPVVSHMPPGDGLVDYSELQAGADALLDDYDTLAVRPFVDEATTTRKQERDLTEVADTLRSSDLVLADAWGIQGGLGQAYNNIQTICDTFSKQSVYILCAFDPFDGSDSTHNYGPLFASMTPAIGFGDYLFERREPFTGSGPQTQNRYIRYYSHEDFERRRFKGVRYSGAAQSFGDTEYLEPDHCQYCRVFSNAISPNRKQCKRFMKGHFVKSAMNHLVEMEDYSGEELDMDGFHNLKNHLGEDVHDNEA